MTPSTAPVSTQPYRFDDLVDIEAFRAMMKSFYEATGLLHGLVDCENRVISACGWQEACTEFHRAYPISRQRCEESNRYMAANLGASGYVGCACRNGLMDFATPIVVEGRQVATLYFGQLLHEPPDMDFFRRQAQECGFDEEAYLAAIRKVPVIPRERIEPIMAFFVQQAQMLASVGLDRLRQREAERRFGDMNRELGRRVDERTAELAAEIFEHRRTEATLVAREAELRRQSEFRQTLLDGVKNSGLMMVVVEEGMIVYHSDPYLGHRFGYPEGDPAITGHFIDFVHPDDRADLMERYRRRVLGEPPPPNRTVRIVHRDGNWHEYELYVAVIPGTAPVQILATIRDVSDRKALEAAREAALAEATQLANAHSKFLAQISHELRTPLNGILGYAQLLESDAAMTPQQHAGLAIIRQSGDALLTLINNIIDHVSIDADKIDFDVTDIRLDAFLDAIGGSVGAKADAKCLKFVRTTAANLPRVVRGDVRRLRQALLNLLDNAVKFTERGSIALHASLTPASRLRFEVRDTGIGIDPAQHEAIFQPFSRAGQAERWHGGAGLGLSLSRQLVRGMGGDIAVESEPGKGSTFSIELDVDIVQPAAADGTPQPDAQQQPVPAPAPLLAPPEPELKALHELARRGNMRKIEQYADHLIGIEEGYRPFAEQLRRLATAYQSQSILRVVEQCRIARIPRLPNLQS